MADDKKVRFNDADKVALNAAIIANPSEGVVVLSMCHYNQTGLYMITDSGVGFVADKGSINPKTASRRCMKAALIMQEAKLIGTVRIGQSEGSLTWSKV